ncbi:hypothetical protein BB559_000713 [Furculomyces boomerangus]|uniref:Translation machinery-associated protein 16 n=1 Tax=Furculomyces boomerangus TaxID=61424 RepID=A0A2T9Z4B3_9FUNG|nr:hypothetical protein BB559_000713 [Furculomyces boomerangus]
MPNNKKKSLKSIRGKDKAHPYSRKAKQMHRAIERSDKLDDRKDKHLTKNLPKAQKFVWFKEKLKFDDSEKKKNLKKEELYELAKEYIQRNDDMVEQIKANRRENRQLTSKDELFIDAVNKEKREAEVNGLEVPTLTESSVFKALMEWDGDLNSIRLVKSARVTIKL